MYFSAETRYTVPIPDNHLYIKNVRIIICCFFVKSSETLPFPILRKRVWRPAHLCFELVSLVFMMGILENSKSFMVQIGFNCHAEATKLFVEVPNIAYRRTNSSRFRDVAIFKSCIGIIHMIECIKGLSRRCTII